jgi:hypothetical protein
MRFAQNDNSIIEMSFCSISSFNKHKNTQTYAYKYNLRNDEGLYFAVDNPDNIEFTYVKRQLQSLCGNKFAVSNPLDYTIKIYTLNNTDTIIVKRLKEQWDNPKYSEITIDRNSPKKDIPNLMLVRDSLFMIETVDFIGSDTLIVQWSKPHFEESIPIYRKNYIDIWKINDKNAELISENIPDEEVYGEDGLYLPEIGRFRYKNGYLYSVKKIPFLTNKLPNGTDIRKMIDDYQIRNNFSDRYSVYLYKLK